MQINNRWGWNKDVLGGKKGKINNLLGGGGDYSGLENNGISTIMFTNQNCLLFVGFW